MTSRTLPALALAAAALLAPPAQADDAEALCRRIAAKLSSVSLADCLGERLRDGGDRSVDGLPLLTKEYPPLPGRRPPLGRVLLIGGTHGDEYSAVSSVFKWMKTLDAHHSGLFHWLVVPLLNPDGLLRPTSQRMNANGVDLNRNFPTPDWGEEASRYWREQEFSKRRFPGYTPGSEPETRFVMRLIDEFKPDAIISVHSPYGVVDVDGPIPGPSKLGSLRLRLLGNYPGSLGRYGGLYKGIPVMTVELTSSSAMPRPYEISAMWDDLVGWLRQGLSERPVRQVKVPEERGPS